MNSGKIQPSRSGGVARKIVKSRSGVKLGALQKMRWFGLCRDLGLITGLFFVNRAGLPGNVVAYASLCILAWSSPLNALKALTISGLILIANPQLIESSIVVSVGKFILIAVAAAKWWAVTHALQRHPFAQAHQKALLGFCLTAAVLIPINSYFAMVSLLKLSVFMTGAAMMLGIPELRLGKTRDLVGWFMSVVIFVTGVSMLTIPLGLSRVVRNKIYLGDSIGLSGISNQPQALGGMLALLAIVSFSLFAFTKLRQRVYFLWAFLVLLAPLLLTQSRTAVFAVAGALVVATLLSPAVVSKARSVFRSFSSTQLLKVALPLLGLALVGQIFVGGKLDDSMRKFLVKDRRDISEGLSFDSIAWDRMRLITESWETFLENPLTGINFGTSKNAHFVETASLLGAPTEKGLIVTAVLEEVGVIGAVAFMIFVGVMIRHFWLRGNIVGLSTIIGLLILNFGEMSFFSFGGIGLLLWSIVSLSIAIGYSCSNDVLRARKRRKALAVEQGRPVARAKGETTPARNPIDLSVL